MRLGQHERGAACLYICRFGPELVAVAAHSVGDATGLVERIALWVLGGVALTPMIAYLMVANVFIYLNLRYEFFYSPRGR